MVCMLVVFCLFSLPEFGMFGVGRYRLEWQHVTNLQEKAIFSLYNVTFLLHIMHVLVLIMLGKIVLDTSVCVRTSIYIPFLCYAT